MAWLEKIKGRYRIRDRADGKTVTVHKDVGIWKDIAEARLTDYRKGKAAGEDGAILAARRMKFEEACDVFFKHHSPGLKPSSARDMRYRLERVKRTLDGKYLDDITKYDVRDLLARYGSVGDRLKYLRVLTTLFNRFEEWNEDAKLLHYVVRIPGKNPCTKWRKEMKSADKKELPRERVLSPEEWQRFRPHLTKRGQAICDLALRRFLRTCDIQKITHLSIANDEIKGLQAKTGEPFRIPTLDQQPTKYDFTNFRFEFDDAKVKAGMNWPVGHPLHFNVRDLRRTGATWAWQETRDLVGISKMLGHTTIETTIRYLHINKADLQKIAKAVDRIALRWSTGGAESGKRRQGV